jgi:glycosyltransferase involved in cell wall biosynthesis
LRWLIFKICFVSFEYPPFSIGGAGEYANNITNELAKLGHDIYVIAPSVNEMRSGPKKGLNILSVQITNKTGLRFLSFQLNLRRTLFSLMRKVDIDILHINGVSGVSIGKSLIPQVVTIHHVVRDIQERLPFGEKVRGFTGEGNPLIQLVEKRQLQTAYKIIAVSQATKQSLKRHYNVDENDIFVVYNGVYHSLYKFSRKEIEETRAEFGINESAKLIFCPAARINEPRKGIVYLLKALPLVLSKTDIVCIISGFGEERLYNQYLRGLPEGVVRFVGLLDETTKRKMFAACDVMALPSLLEGCPLSILEALAAGSPIVSTTVGSIPELVKNGRNGILVEPANPIAISEAITQLVNNEEISAKIRKNNYKDTRDTFSWEEVAKKTEKVYRYVVHEKHSDK